MNHELRITFKPPWVLLLGRPAGEKDGHRLGLIILDVRSEPA